MKLRPVTFKDADFLLTLKNDPEVRKWAIITKEEIKKENHLIWLDKKLKEFNVFFSIILKHGEPVGDIRVEQDGELSVRIIPGERGKGLAFTAISRIAGMTYAKIVEGNIASMNLFIKSGYKFVSYKEGVYILKK